MGYFSWILLLSVGCSSVQAEAPKPGGGFIPKATAALAEFQAAWDQVKSFRASYTQSVTSKLIPGSPDKTVGKISLVKPDRLRWQSETDGSLHLLQGRTLTTVRKNSRGTNEVEIYRAINTADAKAMSLLTGKTPLAKLYKPKLLKSETDSVFLQLTEKKKGGESYVVTIRRADQTLTAIQIESEDSLTRIEFSEPEKNPQLNETDFSYLPGKDDVVHKQ